MQIFVLGQKSSLLFRDAHSLNHKQFNGRLAIINVLSVKAAKYLYDIGIICVPFRQDVVEKYFESLFQNDLLSADKVII